MLRCQDTQASEQYFSTMPWLAMLHAKAKGVQGLALRDKFAITTIPALVLLDGEGAVLCWNAHERLRDDPQGTYFPWQSTPAALRIPQVDFDIVAHSQPDGASKGTPLWRPPGKPPPFGTVRPDSVQDPGDQGSTRLRRKTHDKGRGNSSLVGSQVGASPCWSYPSTHGTHIQAQDCGLRNRSLTKTSPQARCASLPKYCIQSSSSLSGNGSIQS